MAGGSTNARNVVDVWAMYSNAAVTANQILGEYLVLFPCQITAVAFLAVTAGVGAGNTVIEVQLFRAGVIYQLWANAANKPTLASASAQAEFTNTRPTTTALRPGDRLSAVVDAIPATTGHARVIGSVALERVR